MDFGFLSAIRLTELLPWVLPPLLGAVIGYVTNAIAIRMLFRPLTKVRVLGVPLPLTPGIIPRQRGQLAESIGQMVSRELLTEEAVRLQLASAGFQVRVEQNIHSLLGQLISTPLERLRGRNHDLVFASVEGFLSESLYSFFSSRSFIHGVRTIISRLLRSLGGRTVEELIGDTDVGALVMRKAIPALSEPENRGRIAAALEGWLERQRQGERLLDSVLSEELTRLLADLLATLLPSGLDSLFRWLDQEQTREEMNSRGKSLLRTVLEKLNVLQRFVITAGQFDRTLEQKMPEIVEEAVSALRSYAYQPQTLEQIKGILQRMFSGWRRKPAAELFGRIRPGFAAQLVERLLLRIGEQKTRDAMAAGINRVLSTLRQRSLGEILTRYLRIPEGEANDYLSNKVLTFLSRKEASQAIAAEVVSFSRSFIEEHRRDTIAELLHLEPALQDRAASYLSVQLIRIVDARLPAIIESFDVRSMVVDKINGLDVAQVENLLLMVIKKHLRWINIFGGILGALIGFSQLLLRLLT